MSMYKLVSPGGETSWLEAYFEDEKAYLRLADDESFKPVSVINTHLTDDGMLEIDLEDGSRLFVDRQAHDAWAGSDIRGLWVHALRSDVQIDNAVATTQIDGEICVSSLGELASWGRNDFVALLFKGHVRELYSRDCYSFIVADGYRAPDPDSLTYSESDEGFLCPMESECIAVLTNRTASQAARDLADRLGVPLIEYSMSDELDEYEETQDRCWEIKNPEVLISAERKPNGVLAYLTQSIPADLQDELVQRGCTLESVDGELHLVVPEQELEWFSSEFQHTRWVWKWEVW